MSLIAEQVLSQVQCDGLEDHIVMAQLSLQERKQALCTSGGNEFPNLIREFFFCLVAPPQLTCQMSI